MSINEPRSVTATPGPLRPWHRHWPEVVLALALGGTTAIATWQMYAYIDARSIGSEQWFQSDLERVYTVLTDRYSGLHERSRIHPLYSLLNTPAVYFLRRVISLETETAVRVWTSMVAGFWALTFYVAARAVRLAAPDAALAVVIGVVSAAGLCWLAVPETYALGSVTLLIPVIVASLHQRRPFGEGALTAVTAASVSVTLTNIMSGLALLAAALPLRRAAQIAVNACFAVGLLQVGQNYVFRGTHFMGEGLSREHRFLFDRSAGTVVDKAAVMAVHAVIMPVADTPIEFDTGTPMVSFQRARIGSSGVTALVGTALWWVLLLWGGWLCIRGARSNLANLTLSLVALGQAGLHIVYGDQTFLYSLHFVPVFILVALQAVTGSRSLLARGLVLLLMACLLVNNIRQMSELRQTLDRLAATPAAQGP